MLRPSLLERGVACGGAIWLASVACALSAGAVTIELKDVASDRVERQRAFAVGALPLAGTPDLASFEQRLAAKNVKAGDQIFIRIFKAESELEVWMRSGNRFVLFATYPVCHWSGTIGPKIHEGDKQTPEGFYQVTRQQLHLIGRHPRSLNLGFPNAFDKSNQRTGSYILVHGGCSSVGCFAMTNSVVAEIYDLSEKALKSGQERINVHVFPFRMTDANMALHAKSEWMPFWQNLKQGYDAFEQTELPPQIGVCERRYRVEPTGPEEVASHGPLAVCGEQLAANSTWDRLTPSARRHLSTLSHRASGRSAATRQATNRLYPQPRLSRRAAAQPHPNLRQTPLPSLPADHPSDDRLSSSLASVASLSAPSQTPVHTSLAAASPEALQARCELSLTSCRKWLALQRKVAAKALAFRDGQPPLTARRRTAARIR